MRMLLSWLVSVAALAGAAVAQQAADGVDPANAVFTLTLDRAVAAGGERGASAFLPLTVTAFCSNGVFHHAWAETDEGNSAVWAADASRLRASGRQVAGALRVFHRCVQYDYTLAVTAQADRVSGAFDCRYGATPQVREVAGTATGFVQRAAVRSDACALDVGLGKPMVGGNEWQRMARMSISFAGGRVTAAHLYPGRGRAWTSVTESASGALTADGQFTAEVRAAVTNASSAGYGAYSLRLDGRVAGAAVCGRYTRIHQGKDRLDGDFAGSVAVPAGAEADATNGAWTLSLTNAVQGTATLTMGMDCAGGRFAGGVAVALDRQWKAHAADASGLKLAAGWLRGDVILDVNPIGWGQSIWDWPFEVPRPVAYRFAIDMAVSNRMAAGAFKGHPELRHTAGAVTGRLQSRADWLRPRAIAQGSDYPCWRGAFGNGCSTEHGGALVNSLDKARVAWRSSEKTPDAWLWSRPINPGTSGGFSSPVVADDRVFVFYFVPSGTCRASGTNEVCGMPGKSAVLIDADDVMLCLDARTGETLWKTTFEGRGLNFNGGAGPHMTPCYAAGRVYGVGSAGSVYCLDARTGAEVWESSLGEEATRAAALREEAHRTKALAKLNRDFCGAPVVCDGVLLCTDNRDGLIGIDCATGARAWGPVTNCIREVASPVVWRHAGRAYALCALKRAVCVDPRTGALVWEQRADVDNEGTLAVGEHVMVTGGRLGLTCFRIDERGAVKMWSLGGAYSCHVTSPVIYGGHVYGWKTDGTAVCVEVESGKIVGTAYFYSVRSCSSFVATGGRIIRPHLYNKVLLYDTDPATFRQLGDVWVAPSYAECTTPALCDGRMFFRGKDCVYCYDLRVGAEGAR